MVAFSSLARIWGECSTVHSLLGFLSLCCFGVVFVCLFVCLFLGGIVCLFVCLFFVMKISSRTHIPHFTPGSVHSGSASWDDMGLVFPDLLRMSSFPIGSLTMPGQRHNQPTPTSLGQGCMRV